MLVTLERNRLDTDEEGGTSPQRLLERVGLALNSTLDLTEVLHQLAQITLEASGADRCSVFLLEDRTLHPVAAIGELVDDDLFTAFRSMGPIDLESIPLGWELLTAGRAIAIEDATTSSLIPLQWVERFSLSSLVLVPLHVAGEACGLMAVDHQSPTSFSERHLRLLEAIGSYAGVAVRNAHLHESTKRRLELNEGLVQIASALVSPLSRDEVLSLLIDSYMSIFGARICAIGLVDSQHEKVRVVASRGTRKIEDVVEVASIPSELVESLGRVWNSTRAFEIGNHPWLAGYVGGKRAGAARYLLIPLKVNGSFGGILLGFKAHVLLDTEDRNAAEALAAIATASLERSLLEERIGRQVRRLEILHALGDALVERADAGAFTRRLNELLRDQGIEVVGLAFRDRTLARRLGGDEPTPEERESWKQRGGMHRAGSTLSVPMRLGRKLVGSLRVQPADLADEEVAFIEALAYGVAEVTSRGALRAAVEEADRERAVVAERGRIAADLHDTAGQVFLAIGLLARREAEHVPADSPWREKLERLAELAEAGKWEIGRSIQALAFFPEARRGIAPSLKALARSFERDSGIGTMVVIEGTPRRLAPRIERAIYRIAHEALSNAWRHAQCSFLQITLDFRSKEILVRIVDDGIGIKRVGTVGGIGIVGMRRSVEDVGGSLRVRSIQPHGTSVEARVTGESR